MITNDVFERLADTLDKLPNGFPRTPSRVEIHILKKIFSPEEASLAGQLCGDPEPVDEIAQRTGLPAEAATEQLFQMVRRGLVWYDEQDGKALFRLAPFIVGFYMAQLERMDHELAHLVETYLTNGGAAGIMKPQPALHRVVPAQGTVKSEWICLMRMCGQSSYPPRRIMSAIASVEPSRITSVASAIFRSICASASPI